MVNTMTQLSSNSVASWTRALWPIRWAPLVTVQINWFAYLVIYHCNSNRYNWSILTVFPPDNMCMYICRNIRHECAYMYLSDAFTLSSLHVVVTAQCRAHTHTSQFARDCQVKGCGTHFTHEYCWSTLQAGYLWAKWVPTPFLSNYSIID